MVLSLFLFCLHTWLIICNGLERAEEKTLAQFEEIAQKRTPKIGTFFPIFSTFINLDES